MTPRPKRRWSFSLRTLFVVVTVLGCWLGWQVKIVRDRQALRRELELAASDSFEPYVAIGTRVDGSVSTTWGRKWSVNPVPWYRRVLGDEPVGDLGVPNGWTTSDVNRLRAAFPEAAISGPIPNR